MEKYGEKYYEADWEEVTQEIDKAIKTFIKENYPPEVYSDVRFAAQHENMRSNANHLLKYIQTEQQESSFRPIAFEEKIGMDGRIPPLKVTTSKGKTAKVNKSKKISSKKNFLSDLASKLLILFFF